MNTLFLGIFYSVLLAIPNIPTEIKASLPKRPLKSGLAKVISVSAIVILALVKKLKITSRSKSLSLISLRINYIESLDLI